MACVVRRLEAGLADDAGVIADLAGTALPDHVAVRKRRGANALRGRRRQPQKHFPGALILKAVLKDTLKVVWQRHGLGALCSRRFAVFRDQQIIKPTVHILCRDMPLPVERERRRLLQPRSAVVRHAGWKNPPGWKTLLEVTVSFEGGCWVGGARGGSPSRCIALGVRCHRGPAASTLRFRVMKRYFDQLGEHFAFGDFERHLQGASRHWQDAAAPELHRVHVAEHEPLVRSDESWTTEDQRPHQPHRP